MGYRSERDSGAGATAAIIVGVLLLVGLLVVGGGGAMLYVRAQAVRQEQRAMIAMEEARAKAEAVKAAAEAVAARAAAEGAAGGDARAETAEPVALALDEQGNLQADGRPLELADLPAWLATSRDNAGGEFSVLIRVHPGCRFEHVVPVQDACREAEVPFRLETREDAAQPPAGAAPPTNP